MRRKCAVVALPVPAFQDNYIWVVHNGDIAFVVDPGDAAPVLHALEQLALTPVAILITHHHADHIGGIEALRAHYPALPVYGPARERVPCLTHPLEGGENLDLGPDLPGFEVLAVPGHTAAHIAYYGAGMLFCGDTLFTAGCGRVFEGTPVQLFHSLERLAALPDETEVYCAHEYTLENLRFALEVEPGNSATRRRMAETQERRRENLPTVPSSLGEEKRTNPFLRCHEPSVSAAAQHYARRPMAAGQEVFTVIRYWRDAWCG